MAAILFLSVVLVAGVVYAAMALERTRRIMKVLQDENARLRRGNVTLHAMNVQLQATLLAEEEHARGWKEASGQWRRSFIAIMEAFQPAAAARAKQEISQLETNAVLQRAAIQGEATRL